MKKIILSAICALAVAPLYAQETDSQFHMSFGTCVAMTSGLSFAVSDVVPFDARGGFYFDEGFMTSRRMGESNLATVRGFDMAITYIGLGDQALALGEDIGQPAGSYLVDARASSKLSSLGKFSLEMPLGLAWFHNDKRAFTVGAYGAWHVVALTQEVYKADDGGFRVTESSQGRLNSSRFGYGVFADVRLGKVWSLYLKSELTPFFRQRDDLATPMFTSNAIGMRVNIGD